MTQDDGTVDGISVRLWRDIAQQLKLEYQLKSCGSVDAALDAVAKGQAQIAVGPIMVTTDRLQRFDYTQPYFYSDQAILSPGQAKTPRQKLLAFFSWTFLGAVVTLVAVLLLVGVLVWLAEWRCNPDQFPPGTRAGLGAGMWFALATLTSVGYGDCAPVTRRGRIVAGIWMIVGSLSFSTLTAGIASAMTLANLPEPTVSTIEGLRGKAVASSTVEGPHLRKAGVRVYLVHTAEEGVELMRKHTVEALVYSQAGIDYVVRRQKLESQFTVSPLPHEVHNYAFALPQNSALIRPLNVALTRMEETGELDDISHSAVESMLQDNSLVK